MVNIELQPICILYLPFQYMQKYPDLQPKYATAIDSAYYLVHLVWPTLTLAR